MDEQISEASILERQTRSLARGTTEGMAFL